jgi:hypothetical protein
MQREVREDERRERGRRDMGPLATTTAISAAISTAAMVTYNATAPSRASDGWGDLASFATDLVVGGGSAALAALSGVAAISPTLRPAARIGAGIGLGALIGTAAGVGALTLALRHNDRG